MSEGNATAGTPGSAAGVATADVIKACMGISSAVVNGSAPSRILASIGLSYDDQTSGSEDEGAPPKGENLEQLVELCVDRDDSILTEDHQRPGMGARRSHAHQSPQKPSQPPGYVCDMFGQFFSSSNILFSLHHTRRACP
eukprot:scpid92323/ scgid2772/ 